MQEKNQQMATGMLENKKATLEQNRDE